jgi:hypothetical protein
MKQGDCLSFAASPFAHREQRRVAAPAMVALTGAILTKKTRSVRQYFAIELSTLDNKKIIDHEHRWRAPRGVQTCGTIAFGFTDPK